MRADLALALIHGKASLHARAARAGARAAAGRDGEERPRAGGLVEKRITSMASLAAAMPLLGPRKKV